MSAKTKTSTAIACAVLAFTAGPVFAGDNGPGDDPRLPDFGAATFSDPLNFTNPFQPYVPNTLYTFSGVTDENETELLLTLVTQQSRTILGIETRVVHSDEFVDGVIMESTDDFFAQGDDGSLWYLGEDVINYEYDENGNLTGTNDDGSFIAGENGALPGIIFPGTLLVGDYYYEEFAPGIAFDTGCVLGLRDFASVPYGDFRDVLVIEEANLLEPEALKENKIYAPGVGLVLVEEGKDPITGEPEFLLELQSVTTVPEPVSAALVLPMAAVGLGLLRRRSCRV